MPPAQSPATGNNGNPVMPLLTAANSRKAATGGNCKGDA